jgi:hypothetical protein
MRVVIADHSLTVRAVQGKRIAYAMRPAFVRRHSDRLNGDPESSTNPVAPAMKVQEGFDPEIRLVASCHPSSLDDEGMQIKTEGVST